MAHRTRSFRARVTQLLLVVLLVAQGVLAANACAMAPMNASLPFVDGDMPADCADLNKNACLMSYLQADQVVGSSEPVIVGATGAATLSVRAPAIVLSPPAVTPRFAPPPSATPPPRLLYCRMLQ